MASNTIDKEHINKFNSAGVFNAIDKKPEIQITIRRYNAKKFRKSFNNSVYKHFLDALIIGYFCNTIN